MVRGAEPLLISVAHLIHELLRYEWFLWGTPLHVSNRTVAGHADTRAPPAEGEAPPPEHAVDCQGERLAARIV